MMGIQETCDVRDEIFSIAKTLRCVPLETHAIVILKSRKEDSPKIGPGPWVKKKKRSLF